MGMLTIVTFAHTLAGWLNVFISLAVFAGGLVIANKARETVKLALLDGIQIYASWQQARIDAEHKRAKMGLFEGEARLLLRDQRHKLTQQLMAELDEAYEIRT
jgi:hypothetical protein